MGFPVEFESQRDKVLHMVEYSGYEYEKNEGCKEVQKLMLEGNRAMERRDFKQAEIYFIEASEMGSVSAIFNLGWLEKETGNIVRAIMYFLDASFRDETASIIEIGSIYAALGEIETAKLWYQRASELGEQSANIYISNLENDLDYLEDDEEA